MLALLATAACSRDDGKTNAVAGGPDAPPVPGGTMVFSVGTDVDALLPPVTTSQLGRLTTDLLFDRLAEPGQAMNTVGDVGFVPRLATRWEWAPDSLSIRFHLDPRARWHDGRPLRASDVRFTHSLYTDPATGAKEAALLASIDSVSVPDSVTAVFWFKKRSPEQFYDATYQMPIVPEHLLRDLPRATLRASEFAKRPVGSGRFRFARWEPGVRLELVADTANYRGRPMLDRLIWTVSPDFTSAVTKLLAGEADFFEPLRPENVIELAKRPMLRTVARPGQQYAFMQFNLRDSKNRARPHPLFAERGVRRALTMALDRPSLVRNVLDTLAVVAIGPFTRAMSTADTTLPSIGYDTAGAARLLDSLGWRDANGDGVREKQGRPLAFTLLVPSSSKTRVDLAVLLQEQLRRVGARVEVEQMEFNAFLDREAKHTFDAVLGTWGADPSPGNVRQTWGSAGSRAKDGSNYGSYESAVFDTYVDSGVNAMDPAVQKRYFRQAYETIINDAPAVWLYEPRPVAGIHRRVRVAPLRADAWWANLGDWHIPVAERLPRDRTGTATATP